MAEQVGRRPRPALAWAFVEFSCLPDLLARVPAHPGDQVPETWHEFFREYPPNREHIHRGDRPDDGEGEDIVDAVIADAWSLVRRLRLVLPRRLTNAGRTLAGIGARDLQDRTEHDHAVLQQVLGEQVERAYLGAGKLPIMSLLWNAAHGLERSDSRAAAHLPGLLLTEIAYLAELGHADATEARAGAHRLTAIRDEVMLSVGAPDPGEHASWYLLDLADAVNGHYLRTRRPEVDGSMTVTELRATSILLTFTGFFREAFPFGPVQCLAADG